MGGISVNPTKVIKKDALGYNYEAGIQFLDEIDAQEGTY